MQALFYSVIITYFTHFSFVFTEVGLEISEIFCMYIYKMTNQLSKTTLKICNNYNQQVQDFKHTMNQYQV